MKNFADGINPSITLDETSRRNWAITRAALREFTRALGRIAPTENVVPVGDRITTEGMLVTDPSFDAANYLYLSGREPEQSVGGKTKFLDTVTIDPPSDALLLDLVGDTNQTTDYLRISKGTSRLLTIGVPGGGFPPGLGMIIGGLPPADNNWSTFVSRRDSVGAGQTFTAIGLWNAHTLDNTGVVLSFRTTTTGVGATEYNPFAELVGVSEIHDHATAQGRLDFYMKKAGAMTQMATIRTGGDSAAIFEADGSTAHVGSKVISALNSQNSPTTHHFFADNLFAGASVGMRPLMCRRRNTADTEFLRWFFEITTGDTPSFEFWRHSTAAGFLKPLDFTWAGAVRLFDAANQTKIATFNLANISPATTRTFTFPDFSGTFALLERAQTFTAQQTIQHASVAGNGLLLKAQGAGYSGRLLEWQNSSGSPLGYITGSADETLEVGTLILGRGNVNLPVVYWTRPFLPYNWGSIYDGSNVMPLELDAAPSGAPLVFPAAGGTVVSTTATQDLFAKTLKGNTNIIETGANVFTGTSFRDATTATKRLYLQLNLASANNHQLRISNSAARTYTIYDVTGHLGIGQFAATADATVANNVSELSIAGSGDGTRTLPANFFAAGRNLRVTASGYLSTDTIPPTLTIRLKKGSTVLASSGAMTMGAASSQVVWKMSLDITGRSGTTVITNGIFMVGQGSPGLQNLQSSDMLNTAAVTIGSGSEAIDLTAQWGTAHTSNTITCTNLTMQLTN